MAYSESIWHKIVAPDVADLSTNVANYFLSLSIPPEERARYEALAAKEQTELTAEQRADLESLIAANGLLMLLQAKARLTLRHRQPAA